MFLATQFYLLARWRRSSECRYEDAKGKSTISYCYDLYHLDHVRCMPLALTHFWKSGGREEREHLEGISVGMSSYNSVLTESKRDETCIPLLCEKNVNAHHKIYMFRSPVVEQASWWDDLTQPTKIFIMSRQIYDEIPASRVCDVRFKFAAPHFTVQSSFYP